MGNLETFLSTGSGAEFEKLRTIDQTVLDAIPSGVYICSADGTILRSNQRANCLWGRTPRPGERDDGLWSGAKTKDLDQPSTVATPMALVLADGNPRHNQELFLDRPDGSRIAVRADIEPLISSDGRVQGAIASFQEHDEARAIEERKWVENALNKRIKEQGALYRFTDRLHRTQTLDDVYESALDTILEALPCKAASILLFDDSNVMRFVASRGLSEGYRKAVDGHSPWAAGEKDPLPIMLSDIDVADIPGPLGATIRAEGIRALAFIPLLAHGTLFGKFMTYYDAPHDFAADEINLALTIARQLAFGIDRKKSEKALHDNEERLRLATQSGKIGLWEWDIVTDRVLWTESLYAIFGVRREEFSATRENFRALVHPDDRDRMRKALERSLERDFPYELEFRAVKPDGHVIWVFTNGIVLREGGAPIRMLGAAFDITARRQMEEQRDLLIAELSHRVKNTLATVIAIAHQSFSKGPSIEEARSSFDARIRALGQTHGRLAEAGWSGVPLAQIVLDETAPYRGEDGHNVRIAGPAIFLNPKSAVTLGMAFHELTTNAAKYGALSARDGSIDVSWDITPKDSQIHIHWIETGGPAVVAPRRSGFGRLLLEQVLASDLRGNVELSFPKEGFRCDIAFSLENFATHAGS